MYRAIDLYADILPGACAGGRSGGSSGGMPSSGLLCPRNSENMNPSTSISGIFPMSTARRARRRSVNAEGGACAGLRSYGGQTETGMQTSFAVRVHNRSREGHDLDLSTGVSIHNRRIINASSSNRPSPRRIDCAVRNARVLRGHATAFRHEADSPISDVNAVLTKASLVVNAKDHNWVATAKDHNWALKMGLVFLGTGAALIAFRKTILEESAQEGHLQERIRNENEEHGGRLRSPRLLD